MSVRAFVVPMIVAAMALYLLTSAPSDPTTAFYPTMLLFLLIALALVDFFKELLLRKSRISGVGMEHSVETQLSWSVARTSMIGIALLVGYVLSLPLAGYYVSTLVFMFAFARFTGLNLIQAALTALGFVIFSALLFVFQLGVPLPAGNLFP